MDPNQGTPLVLEVSLGHILTLGGILGVSIVLGFFVLGLFLWYALSRLTQVIGVLAREIRAARTEQQGVANGVINSNAKVGEALSELRGYLHGQQAG